MSLVTANTPTTFIYGLVDPRTDEVRYVGKSDNPQRRLRQHLSAYELRRNCYRSHWLKELLAAGYVPQLIVIEETGYDEWERAEQLWIGYFKSCGVKLTNGTLGGEGVRHTPEVRAKLSESLKGNKNWIGRKHTEETKRKLSEILKGRKFTAEHRKKLSEARAGVEVSEETRKKLAETRRGKPCPWNARPLSEEHRHAISNGLARSWVVTSPEGVEYRVTNLRKWCEENQLSRSSMQRVAAGRYPDYKGWTCRKEETLDSRQ